MRKRFVLVTVLALFLSCLLCSAAWADALTPEKLADTKKMLEASESGALSEQLAADMAGQIVAALQAQRPDLDGRTIKAAVREMRAFLMEKVTAPGGLLDRLAPIYAKHFTHDEIKQILAFYESPAGRKVIATYPKLIDESQNAAFSFAREISPEFKRRLDAALRAAKAEPDAPRTLKAGAPR